MHHAIHQGVVLQKDVEVHHVDLVHKVHQVELVHKVHKVELVRHVHKVVLVRQVHKVVVVRQVHKVVVELPKASFRTSSKRFALGSLYWQKGQESLVLRLTSLGLSSRTAHSSRCHLQHVGVHPVAAVKTRSQHRS